MKEDGRSFSPPITADGLGSIQRCITLDGPATDNYADFLFTVVDENGLGSFEVTVSGGNLLFDSVLVEPDVLDIIPSFEAGLLVDSIVQDVIHINFTRRGAQVRTGVVLQFRVEETFTGGVTFSATARDTLGNATFFEPFTIYSEHAGSVCPYAPL